MPYGYDGPLVEIADNASEAMLDASIGTDVFLVPRVDGKTPDTATIETYQGEDLIYETGQVRVVQEDEDEAVVELSPRELHLAAIDFPGLHESNTHALVGLLSFVYVAGRLDQIADEYDSNSRRLVRARHLGKVLDFLQIEVPIGDEAAKAILDDFTKLRGTRKNQPEGDVTE